MATTIKGNVVVGAVPQPVKPVEEKPVPKSVLSNIDEIRRIAHAEPKEEKFVRNRERVIIEKRAKLTDPKPDRKSAYVKDMTTVHEI